MSRVWRTVRDNSLSLAFGAMLLVTVRELIPEACGGAERAGTLSVLAGFLLMMILDVALG